MRFSIDTSALPLRQIVVPARGRATEPSTATVVDGSPDLAKLVASIKAVSKTYETATNAEGKEYKKLVASNELVGTDALLPFLIDAINRQIDRDSAKTGRGSLSELAKRYFRSYLAAFKAKYGRELDPKVPEDKLKRAEFRNRSIKRAAQEEATLAAEV